MSDLDAGCQQRAGYVNKRLNIDYVILMRLFDFFDVILIKQYIMVF